MTDATPTHDASGTSLPGDELRLRAEGMLDELDTPGDVPLTDDIDSMVHELRVHQVELEMQNDELRRAQHELEELRAKYFDLFDRAPVGYLTINDAGMIVDANMTANRLMGVDRQLLVGKSLSAFVMPVDRDTYYLNHRQLQQHGDPRTFELRLRRVGPDPEADYFWARLDSRPHRDAGSTILSSWVTFVDITENKVSHDERIDRLETVANTDLLTGLMNARGFDLVAAQVIAQAQRANVGVGLVYCDVDGLKTINDEFGHAQGDRALQDVASILKFTLRNADAIARVGGDEFIVLAAGGDGHDVVRLQERLQDGIEFFNAENERPYRVGAASGTAWCARGAPCMLDELRETADAQMYSEKARRRRAQRKARAHADTADTGEDSVTPQGGAPDA